MAGNNDTPQSNPLRIVMLGRATLFTHPGGDTIQLKKTAQFLNRIPGVEVATKTIAEAIDYNQFDLLHLFNVGRPSDLLGVIKKAGLPYVISTVFVDFSETERQQQGWRKTLFTLLGNNGLEYVKTLARVLKGQDSLTDVSYLWRGHRGSVKKVIRGAKRLLPNSHSEYQRLLKAYGVSQEFSVIPNGIDPDVFEGTKELDPQMEKFNNAVISVGQITPVKNQHNMIEALSKTDYPVYLIGSPSSNAKKYYKKCQELAGDNIHFISFVPQQELAKIYQQARVHVLTSWFETTGLVSLEAAYMGCAIVVTPKGDQPEYFESYAHYCDPDSQQSIIDAVDEAFKSGPNDSLREKIKTQYTWQQAAEKTLQAYREVMNETTTAN